MSQPLKGMAHPPKINGTLPPLLNRTHPPLLNRTLPPLLNGTHPPLLNRMYVAPSDTVFALWFIAAIIALIILLTISIALIVFYFKKSCKIPSNKSGKIFIAFFVASLLFWLIEAALTLTNIILTNSESSIALKDEWLGILPKISYNLARALMLFYFIIKSYIVFHGSAYSVSKLFIWILFLLSVAAFVLQVAPLIYNQIIGERTKTTLYYLCIGWCLDFIVSVAAMYKFVAILFKLSLNGIKHSNTPTQKRISLNNTQLRMMRTITRTTVLSIFAVLSSVVFGFFFNPYPLINPRVSGNDLNVAAVADSALNAVCMYLSYAFTLKQYGFCCKYCDIGIEKLCVWCTNKAIQRKTGEKTEDVVIKDENAQSDRFVHEEQSRLAVPSKSAKTHQSVTSDSDLDIELTQTV